MQEKSLTSAKLTVEFSKEILHEVDSATEAALNDSADSLGEKYFNALWRTDSFYPYVDNLRHERIDARIVSVASDGIITLCLRTGEHRSYAFKEISAVVKESLL